MGEAKRRGTAIERRLQATKKRAEEIAYFRENLGLSEDAKFQGYVVHIPETDDFLMDIIENSIATNRKYSKIPDFALCFSEWDRAESVAATLPREAIVGLLFDTGKHFQVGFYTSENPR